MRTYTSSYNVVLEKPFKIFTDADYWCYQYCSMDS